MILDRWKIGPLLLALTFGAGVQVAQAQQTCPEGQVLMSNGTCGVAPAGTAPAGGAPVPSQPGAEKPDAPAVGGNQLAPPPEPEPDEDDE